MQKKILSLLFIFLILSAEVHAAEIAGLDVSVHEDNIIVSTRVRLDENQISDIEKGIPKEIIFYIDLFRAWNYWPDEFVLGKTLTKTLRCDPVKKEYLATSVNGATLTEKRFTGCSPLFEWTLHIPRLRLTNINELEPASYFVKVTVESRLRRLPPVINYLFFFIRETEFSISGKSRIFPLGLKE